MTLFSNVILAKEEKKTAAQEAIERRQKVELLSFFLKSPKDAALPTTPIAVTLYNQAVEYAKDQDYELARRSLRDSLRYDDKNPFAYELLGDMDYLQQNLSEAKANYDIAYALGPRAELKQKIEKLGQESRVEKKLATYREQHFLIKYHNQEKNLEGFELRELLRQTYREISQDFGYYFKHQVVVLVYDEEEFKKITDAPHWVAGLYDGKVRMPVKAAGFSLADLKALTRHEVTHAFVAAMSNGLAPAWLNEGLAEFEENKIKPNDLTVFQAAVKTNTLLSLDQLMSHASSTSLQDPLRVRLFYEQSFHLVRYLAGRYGMFRIKQLLAALGKGENSDEALRSVLHLSTKRLENEWKATF